MIVKKASERERERERERIYRSQRIIIIIGWWNLHFQMKIYDFSSSVCLEKKLSKWKSKSILLFSFYYHIVDEWKWKCSTIIKIHSILDFEIDEFYFIFCFFSFRLLNPLHINRFASLDTHSFTKRKNISFINEDPDDGNHGFFFLPWWWSMIP